MKSPAFSSFRAKISRGAEKRLGRRFSESGPEKATGNPLLERSRFPAPPARTFILLAVDHSNVASTMT